MVDLIIINFNTKDLTSSFIISIMQNTNYPYTIFVVDNGSTDGSVPYLKEKFPTINIIEMGENTGYAKACNVGARNGIGKYIMFLNSDMLATPNWITPLIDMMEKDPFVAVVGPKLVNQDNKIVGVGVVGTNKNPRIRGWLEPNDATKYTKEIECVSVCGAAYMIRRNYTGILGWFDESYPFYFEETDYSYHVRDRGYKVMYCPKSTLIHFHQGSSKDNTKLREWFLTGQKIFDSKWEHMMGDTHNYE